MGKYQGYPEYELINAEWFSEIPTGWSVTPLKHVATINMGQSPSSEDCNIDGIGVPFLQGNAEFGAKSPTEKQFCPIPKKVAKAGDLLFSVRAPVGALNFANKDFGIGRGLCSIRGTNAVSQTFLWWVLPSYKYQFDAIATGSTFEAVSAEEVGNLNLALPPMVEQTQIANFLDHETAKIDTLIKKQQLLIKLLKEKRQAVISHAVTKGLNPQAPMRDSGVQWLGEVPKHWDSCLIKYKCSEVTDGAHISPETNGGEHYFVSIRDIKDGVINFEEALLTSPKSYQYLVKTGCLPFDGDILFSKDGTIGQTAITPKDIEFVVASSLIIIRPDREKVTPEFLDFLLQSSVVKEQVESFVKGAALRRLSIQNLLKVFGVFPPLDEQVLIAEFIQHQLSKYRELERKAIDQVELLKERRTALISAAVTGKIDVRNWQAPTSQVQALEQTA